MKGMRLRSCVIRKEGVPFPAPYCGPPGRRHKRLRSKMRVAQEPRALTPLEMLTVPGPGSLWIRRAERKARGAAVREFSARLPGQVRPKQTHVNAHAMSFWRWTLVVVSLGMVRGGAEKKVDVQHALQQLLGVPSGDRVLSSTPPLPSYMMELYERYKSGDMLGTKQGNTVRSIQAFKDSRTSHRLLFNLSGIHQQERVLKVELHLYQRPKRPETRDRGANRVRLTAVDETQHQDRIETVEASANNNGWSVYDVTDGVRGLRARLTNSTTPFLLGVRSASRTSTGKKHRKLATRKMFSRSGSVPFLIVFSQDKNSLQSDTLLSDNETSEGLSRPTRSLMDNRVVEDDFGLSDNEFPQTKMVAKSRERLANNNPGLLLPRGRSKLRPSGPTPYPPFGKDLKKIQSRRRPNKSHNEAHKLDFCQRKKLVVDFAQIGWGKWIIFPKTFEAHYCAGVCPFPLTKNVNPSNHATIQSLVHALGVSRDVPAPCCVPSVMSSMSLLYLDQDGDVVLKNYPQMTIESCACR